MGKESQRIYEKLLRGQATSKEYVDAVVREVEKLRREHPHRYLKSKKKP